MNYRKLIACFVLVFVALKPGMAVADVGAGTGLFTRKFAAEVGDKGKVYAVDISPTFLRHIEKTCSDAKLNNVWPVLCDQFSTKLPKNSVDLVFICDTYHHFEFPQRTLQSIHDALRPGGQVVLIDFHRIKGKSSDFVMGHVRAGQEVFVGEVTAAGFKVVGEEKLLKENYFVRFEKKELMEGKLNLHVVPTPIKSYRLLSMSMDDDGFIWAGAIHKVVHRYDPRTGRVDDFAMPYPATASACICVGTKVYILGQTYPKLIILDRTTKKFSEVAYPGVTPNVWYGTEAIDGRHIFLFDRGGAGVIKMGHADRIRQGDSLELQGYRARRWPLRTEGQGHLVPGLDLGSKYVPIAIARLDVEKNEFTGYHIFPHKGDDGLKPYTDPATTLFLPYTLKGKIVPFDFKEKRWCKFIDVPQYGMLFGFMGGPIPHKDRLYFSLSTYNGTDVGCDGKPYHFCNAILEFDPQTGRFEFPTLEVKDAYHQVAYMLSARGEFFATGSNIRERDGKLNRDRAGEAVFWQTVKRKRARDEFKEKLDKVMTPAKAVTAFGEPDRKLGSGLIIYEYDLDDGSKVRLGFPGYVSMQYAHHVRKDGKFVDIPIK